MATFTTYNNRLPDPTFNVDDAGVQAVSGIKGPGFASVNVISSRPVEVSRTVSGRGVHRESGAHTWDINITYHPMRRDQFDVVSSFLEARGGRMRPFFVVLPQYSKPKDSLFALHASANIIRAAGAHAAGSSRILIQSPGVIAGSPKAGDMLTISDPNDVNHMKAYKVTRVETNALYESGMTQPGVNQVRVHTSPPLTKFVADQAVINWIDPQFRVIQKNDTIEYQLSTDNLWQFGLNLEEIQP